MRSGSGWDESCQPTLLKAHTQPMTSHVTSEEPLPWATFYVKALDSRCQAPESGLPSATVPTGPPRLKPCAGVLLVGSWAFQLRSTWTGRSVPTHSRPHQGAWSSELLMSRYCMLPHRRKGPATFHQLGLCEVTGLTTSLIHISCTEDKLLHSHTQP